jgi:hypothetical protein
VIPSSRVVWSALAATGHPALLVGTRRMGPGEEAWRRDMGGRSFLPAERVAILARLGRRELLVVASPGRVRLRRYLNRQWARPMTDDPSESVADRVRRLVPIYGGDTTMVTAIIDGFCRAYTPVREIVGEESYVIAVGGSRVGWTSRPLDTGGRCPIVIGGGRAYDEIVLTVLHEIAHRWYAPIVDSPVYAADVTHYAEVAAQFLPEAVARVAASESEEERLVDLCARAWSVGTP